MTSNITVTVIIPTFNRGYLLAQCLQSVRKAFKENSISHEVIVVDDGSNKEDIKGLISTHFPFVHYIYQKNQGAPTARNRGIQEAEGKYLVLLDSDDLIEPDFFEAKIALLESNTALAGVYGPWDHFMGDQEFNECEIIPRHTPYPLESSPCATPVIKRLLGGWYIPSHAFLWRREALQEVGGQNENLSINQDVELVFKILINEGLIQGVESGRALIRDHEGERVGKIRSETKLKDILELRKSFYEQLYQKEVWNSTLAKPLARFLLMQWYQYRKQFPETALAFYQLSRQLYKGNLLKGTKFLQFLGGTVGNKRALWIKDFINALR